MSSQSSHCGFNPKERGLSEILAACHAGCPSSRNHFHFLAFMAFLAAFMAFIAFVAFFGAASGAAAFFAFIAFMALGFMAAFIAMAENSDSLKLWLNAMLEVGATAVPSHFLAFMAFLAAFMAFIAFIAFFGAASGAAAFFAFIAFMALAFIAAFIAMAENLNFETKAMRRTIASLIQSFARSPSIMRKKPFVRTTHER